MKFSTWEVDSCQVSLIWPYFINGKSKLNSVLVGIIREHSSSLYIYLFFNFNDDYTKESFEWNTVYAYEIYLATLPPPKKPPRIKSTTLQKPQMQDFAVPNLGHYYYSAILAALVTRWNHIQIN